MEGLFGVRKGAWTPEEDNLLRKCVDKYGEGKWHQVPLKAGLNRCRKSCRLRWLNYLKPNIKKGEFEADEVDLIIRLHKLLGNRWALIAGRIPGRTANDVKNYWNTHLRKKEASARINAKKHSTPTMTKASIIKPRPFNLPKKVFWSSNGKTPVTLTTHVPVIDNNNTLCKPCMPSPPLDDHLNGWLESLFNDNEVKQKDTSCASGSGLRRDSQQWAFRRRNECSSCACGRHRGRRRGFQ
ncbi:transcription factor MYB90 [Manihot esculenta]|uniref:MYB transcription factor n=1 Tax=Manihot esculenta TaxID=3983 RepID=A0A2C9WK05_MANES|nr:transcription factor MYB90 [Manihot esculenta]OAY60494.1 hypothetical protein MANES_01G117100v8 [Manihot esculenta]